MRYRLLLAVAAAVATLDALTKAAAVALSASMPIRLPGGWALRVVHNNGVVTGIGAGTIAPDVFAVIAVIQIAVLVWFNRHRSSAAWAVGMGLILGGGAGNLGEHQVFSSVVDWIQPPHPSIVFDLADIAVACGQLLLVSLLLLSLLTGRARTRAVVTR